MGLLETIMAMALLSLLFLATGLVLRQTFTVLHKVESEASLTQQFQVVASRMSQDIMASCEQGISLQSNAIAILSPERSGQPPDFSGLQAYLLWQMHKIYFLESATGELRLRQELLATPSSIAVALTPIPTSDGQVLARGVTQVTFQRQGPHLRVRLQGQQRRYGGQESVVHELGARARN